MRRKFSLVLLGLGFILIELVLGWSFTALSLRTEKVRAPVRLSQPAPTLSE